jgi:hypothetical protein
MSALGLIYKGGFADGLLGCSGIEGVRVIWTPAIPLRRREYWSPPEEPVVVLCISKSYLTEVIIFSRWNSAFRNLSSLGSESILRFSLAGDTILLLNMSSLTFLF